VSSPAHLFPHAEADVDAFGTSSSCSARTVAPRQGPDLISSASTAKNGPTAVDHRWSVFDSSGSHVAAAVPDLLWGVFETASFSAQNTNLDVEIFFYCLTVVKGR